MKFYLEQIADVFAHVGSSRDGLSRAQAEERLTKYGKNKLDEAKKKSLLRRFVEQMLDPMIIILLVAAAVSGALAVFEHEFPTDVIIILTVVIINAVLGVYQESKAEAAIEALQEMSAATSKVLRDGMIVSVKSEELVPGDVVLLEAGDAVPADCRIFECASMKIEEAALTGESVPVTKLIDKLLPKEKDDVPLGDRKNMVYMGSVVVYGRGKAVVVATGMNTEMGKIADAISRAEEGDTPLQIKLGQLSKILSVAVVGISVFIFAFSLIQQVVKGEPLHFDFAMEMFMVAVSLAVAAIPEGLAAVVTVVLSIGVTNMSKKNAIIRKLTAVETLGCAQIICSDKTGTLTQNKMTVTDHYGDNEVKLATGMALCTDAEIESDGSVIGEPTEVALVNYASSLSLPKGELKKKFPRVGEAPFDSGRKMMSTVHKTENGIYQFTKGAPDEVLKKCVAVERGGNRVKMTAELLTEILADNKRMADKALRVLALAYKKYDAEPESYESSAIENDLVFIGLAGMIDPVRPEVKDAIDECRLAGITPIMITGDHRDTAVAIATELGIISDPSQAMTGSQIDDYSDEEFGEVVANVFVYARVQPEHKTKIVTAWKNRGMITAMTGDGVNDAPSIKSADIGVGMGITGTDVTKNVSDMVLADDNFATIVSAVSEGRRIYDNIRKAIQFLLGSNLSEVVSIFTATIFSFTVLKPVHLLWINLVTDCFPALALGTEKAERDIMRRRPRSSKDGIFAGGMGVDVIYQGLIVATLTLVAYALGNMMSIPYFIEYIPGDIYTQLINGGFFSLFTVEKFHAELEAIKYIAGSVESNLYLQIHGNGMTMAFLTMSMCEIFHSFNMRSQRGSVIVMGVKGSHNKFLYFAMAASLVLTTAVIYVPFLANAFDFTHISIQEYAVALLLAFSIVPIVEIVKLVQRSIAGKRAK